MEGHLYLPVTATSYLSTTCSLPQNLVTLVTVSITDS